jgi:hypothetical protein
LIVPVRWALLLALLLGSAARAEAAPSRTKRAYTVTYTLTDSGGNSATPVTRTVDVVNCPWEPTEVVEGLGASNRLRALLPASRRAGASPRERVDGLARVALHPEASTGG